MSTKTREKSSVILEKTECAFGKTPFKKAFPEIKTIRVHVEEDGKSHIGSYFEQPRIRTFDENSLGEFMDCSNLLCYNGGFSIGNILREIVTKKVTHHEARRFCQGWEGSENRRVLSCSNKFDITIDIEYH